MTRVSKLAFPVRIARRTLSLLRRQVAAFSQMTISPVTAAPACRSSARGSSSETTLGAVAQRKTATLPMRLPFSAAQRDWHIRCFSQEQRRLAGNRLRREHYDCSAEVSHRCSDQRPSDDGEPAASRSGGESRVVAARSGISSISETARRSRPGGCA